jgi:nicotinate-nucleotide adenylyltransferase
MKKQLNIGILGGSFNPIHNGHLEIARYALEKKVLDEVWFMPCKVHPLSKTVISENYRAEMIKLAIADIKGARFSDFELKKSKTSYTFETMRELKSLYPYNFYWIIGSDLLSQMNRWHGYKELQNEVDFLVFHREGYDLKNPGLKIKSLYTTIPDVSSTQIRNLIKEGKSLDSLVPKAVEEYIISQGLYLN